MSEPKLEKNSSFREWQWVSVEQEVAFLSEKYKKAYGKKSKKHWKKPENLIFQQKQYELACK